MLALLTVESISHKKRRLEIRSPRDLCWRLLFRPRYPCTVRFYLFLRVTFERTKSVYGIVLLLVNVCAIWQSGMFMFIFAHVCPQRSRSAARSCQPQFLFCRLAKIYSRLGQREEATYHECGPYQAPYNFSRS